MTVLADTTVVVDRPAVLHPRDLERVTTRAFTETLRDQYGEEIVAEVVHVARVRAGDVVARYLGVAPGAELIRRHAVLRTSRSRRVAAYGRSLIVGDRLPPADRDALARSGGDRRPLGDVLAVGARPRQLLHWQVGAVAPHPGEHYLAEGRRPGHPLVSRHSIIGAGDAPLVLVGEWWPQADPDEVAW